MKLLRVGDVGEERLAVALDEDRYVDVSDLGWDHDVAYVDRSRLEILAAEAAKREASGRIELIGDQRIGPPITRPGKIVCIGLNYADHAAETGTAVPPEPIVFFKATNTLVGPNDDVRVPRGATKVDWEVELGVVIGAECRYLGEPSDAAARIAGYVVSNDVSEREFQLERGGQWVKGKSCETFNPCGPYLVTPDEVGNVDNLTMWLDVNGERRQSGCPATMVFDVPYLVWYLSQFMVLEPGDLINTGTPPGVGMGMNPPQYLRAGDVVELGISKLGSQRQRVIDAP